MGDIVAIELCMLFFSPFTKNQVLAYIFSFLTSLESVVPLIFEKVLYAQYLVNNRL